MILKIKEKNKLYDEFKILVMIIKLSKEQSGRGRVSQQFIKIIDLLNCLSLSPQVRFLDRAGNRVWNRSLTNLHFLSRLFAPLLRLLLVRTRIPPQTSQHHGQNVSTFETI